MIVRQGGVIICKFRGFFWIGVGFEGRGVANPGPEGGDLRRRRLAEAGAGKCSGVVERVFAEQAL